MPIISNSLQDQPVADTRQSYTPALISLAVLYFMMGFITCLNDTLVPFFKKGFTLTYSQSSLVQFYFFLTYGVMSIPAGRIVMQTGYKKGMVLGFGIAAIGGLLFYPASVFHEYALFLAALFVVAIGIVLLQVAANPYITVLGPSRTASARLALIQGIGSLGTTAAPLFGAHFILSKLEDSSTSSEAVRYPYLGIAVLLMLIAFIVSRLSLPVIPVSAGEKENSRGLFSYRQLNFGIIGIFMYVGAEVAVGTFLTNYIVDLLHIPEKEANNYVALYWGCMLVGRLLGAGLLRMLRPGMLLSVCAVAAAALILISINSTGMLAVRCMIAVGLCNAIMFATIFSLAVNGVGKHTTAASGLLSTAICGGAIISYLQGFVKDHYDWHTAFMIPLICYLYILFYGLNGHKPKAI
ncbi:MAG: sugar MFS transporter [Chitinophaga sp.]|uniref:sugar MFS transporter n=1 Tax=Chitinophaga sp. TaxID=1869181 RepID=UPI0025B8233D|nr:sugar MFS transporter [Chitinophaga sp.]MBV8254174.1 sugar MFS transporter [Chitinophaga sp.]